MGMAWQAVPEAELENHFNPRIAVPDAEDYLSKAVKLGAEARNEIASRSSFDVRYGENPKQTLDACRPVGKEPACAVVFFHGGYWRALDKSDHSHFALPFKDALFLNVNYDLCPTVSLDEIIRQGREAVMWAAANAGELGGDPKRLFLYGHSAGAHIAAMLLGEDLGDVGDSLRGVAAMSGIYEPQVTLRLTVNAEIGLDPDTAERNDTLARPLRHKPPVLITAGGAEPEGWIGQSRAYRNHLEAQGVSCLYSEIPGYNHFSYFDGLSDPESDVIRMMRKWMESTGPQP